MVHEAKMGEFMKDDVVANEDGCLDESPVQRDRSPPRTGAPTGFLVSDDDAAKERRSARRVKRGGLPGCDCEPVRGCQPESFGREFGLGKAAQVSFDGWAEVAGIGRNPDGLAREVDGMFYLDEFDHGTAENDFGSDGPGSVWSEPAGLAKELLFEPRRLSACEVESVLG
jgi:hypothetical protein